MPILPHTCLLNPSELLKHLFRTVSVSKLLSFTKKQFPSSRNGILYNLPVPSLHQQRDWTRLVGDVRGLSCHPLPCPISFDSFISDVRRRNALCKQTETGLDQLSPPVAPTIKDPATKSQTFSF